MTGEGGSHGEEREKGGGLCFLGWGGRVVQWFQAGDPLWASRAEQGRVLTKGLPGRESQQQGAEIAGSREPAPSSPLTQR